MADQYPNSPNGLDGDPLIREMMKRLDDIGFQIGGAVQGANNAVGGVAAAVNGLQRSFEASQANVAELAARASYFGVNDSDILSQGSNGTVNFADTKPNVTITLTEKRNVLVQLISNVQLSMVAGTGSYTNASARGDITISSSPGSTYGNVQGFATAGYGNQLMNGSLVSIARFALSAGTYTFAGKYQLITAGATSVGNQINGRYMSVQVLERA